MGSIFNHNFRGFRNLWVWAVVDKVKSKLAKGINATSIPALT